MIADPSLLTEIMDMVPSAVTFPDGSASRATQRDTLVLNENLFPT